MNILFGSDHGGATLKKDLVEHIRTFYPEVNVIEFGARDTTDTCDYPDVARQVCNAVLEDKGKEVFGVLICGTGIGISIAANKVPGIRCGLVHEAFTARMAREHNDANVIALGARVVGVEIAKASLDAFLKASFQAGRHKTRVDKIEMSS